MIFINTLSRFLNKIKYALGISPYPVAFNYDEELSFVIHNTSQRHVAGEYYRIPNIIHIDLGNIGRFLRNEYDLVEYISHTIEHEYVHKAIHQCSGHIDTIITHAKEEQYVRIMTGEYSLGTVQGELRLFVDKPIGSGL